MTVTPKERRYGIVSHEGRSAKSGLEFVQGLADRTLPLNSMARTLGYDVVEASDGRVVVTAYPSVEHPTPKARSTAG